LNAPEAIRYARTTLTTTNGKLEAPPPGADPVSSSAPTVVQGTPVPQLGAEGPVLTGVAAAGPAPSIAPPQASSPSLPFAPPPADAEFPAGAVLDGPATPVSPPTAPVISVPAPPVGPDRPPARAAAQRAAELAGKGKQEVDRLWSEFLGLDRFLRWKIYVAASYAVAVALTLFIAWPRNAIGAEVRIERHPLSGEPIVSVSNVSDDPWDKIVIRVNDEWEHASTSLDADGRITVVVSSLVKRDPTGKVTRAPRTLVPRKVVVETAEGEFTWEPEP
jgi:hypothetical protein